MTDQNSRPHFNKPRLLIIGCGDVGRRMLPNLTKFFKVFALTSQADKAQELRLAGVVPLVGDLDQLNTLKRLASLASIVIHLAPPSPQGMIDQRTKNLLRILSHTSKVRRFIYISTSGVYGDCSGAWVSEERSTKPQSARGQRRLDAEERIRAWAVQFGVNVSIFRVPGIYASNRLPLERLKARTPALVPNEDVYTNHIHADDLARLIMLAVFRAVPQRIFNASDRSHLKMGEYFDLVAKSYQLPMPPRFSRIDLEDRVSPMLLSFMSESRRLENHRLSELGFVFRYPTVADFLKNQPQKPS